MLSLLHLVLLSGPGLRCPVPGQHPEPPAVPVGAPAAWLPPGIDVAPFDEMLGWSLVNPHSERAAADGLAIARIYRQHELWSAALQRLEATSSKDPSINALLRFEAGFAHFNRAEFTQSVAALEEAIRQVPAGPLVGALRSQAKALAERSRACVIWWATQERARFAATSASVRSPARPWLTGLGNHVLSCPPIEESCIEATRGGTNTPVHCEAGLREQALDLLPAAAAWDLLSKDHPGWAPQALCRAGWLYTYEGQLDQADQAFARMASVDPGQADRIDLMRGTLLEWKGEDQTLRRWDEALLARKHLPTDLSLLTSTRLGRTGLRLNRQEEAQQAFRATIAVFEALPPAKREALSSPGRRAVAEARFQEGERLQRLLRAQPLVRPAGNLKNVTGEMLAAIRAREAPTSEARSAYLSVIELRDPTLTLAALARIGEMFEWLAEDERRLQSGPPQAERDPPRLSTCEQGSPTLAHAKQAYELCLGKARELKTTNAWSTLCEHRLAELKPEKYRFNAEIRSTPTHQGPDFIGVRLETERRSPPAGGALTP